MFFQNCRYPYLNFAVIRSICTKNGKKIKFLDSGCIIYINGCTYIVTTIYNLIDPYSQN